MERRQDIEILSGASQDQAEQERLSGGAPYSAVKRAFQEDGVHKTYIGGQALIEGVMMRGKNCWAVGVREPNGGLFAQEYPLSKKGNRPAWFSWPLVRGCVALVDSLALGFKALEIAANKAFDDEEKPECISSENQESTEGSLGEKQESTEGIFGENQERAEAASIANKETTEVAFVGQHDESAFVGQSDETVFVGQPDEVDKDDDGVLSKGEMALAMVLGVILAVALFIFLPAIVSNVLVGEYEQNPFAWNIVDGIARVAIFVFYVWLIGRMSDIKRMFSYHGAEHKTIHCYEHGLELTPENARQFPRLHVRCGTAFLIMVMLIAIVVYTVIPLNELLEVLGITGSVAFVLLIVVRILFLPIIAGISYEITVKWAGSHPENPLVRVVLWPGMQMQRLTTNEPDDGMLECAIAAMKLVLQNEERL